MQETAVSVTGTMPHGRRALFSRSPAFGSRYGSDPCPGPLLRVHEYMRILRLFSVLRTSRGSPMGKAGFHMSPQAVL